MYTKLINALHKPAIYTKSKAEFWNDEYISSQMLKAHLDPDFEGASRTLNFIEASVNWIAGLVPPKNYPSLLDIGCGPGIYAERFDKKGYNVTGIDFSKRSINYAKNSAKSKALDISYYYQDYLKMELNQSFDFITMIYCDYGALSTTDRKIILKKMYEHLKIGGKLLFDVFSMKKYQEFKENETWHLCENGGFWRADEHIELNGCYKYPDNVTLKLSSIISKEEVTPYYIWDTYFTKETLITEVKQAGFKVVELFGDVAGKAYDETSDTIAVLLEK